MEFNRDRKQWWPVFEEAHPKDHWVSSLCNWVTSMNKLINNQIDEKIEMTVFSVLKLRKEIGLNDDFRSF